MAKPPSSQTSPNNQIWFFFGSIITNSWLKMTEPNPPKFPKFQISKIHIYLRLPEIFKIARIFRNFQYFQYFQYFQISKRARVWALEGQSCPHRSTDHRGKVEAARAQTHGISVSRPKIVNAESLSPNGHPQKAYQDWWHDVWETASWQMEVMHWPDVTCGGWGRWGPHHTKHSEDPNPTARYGLHIK